MSCARGSRVATRLLQTFQARQASRLSLSQRCIHAMPRQHQTKPASFRRYAPFSTSQYRPAQPPTADALMESINDLYATAKDEFEIAAEETEANTVYAADDRIAAAEAFKMLKEGFEKAVRESDPETGKEVSSRVGSRIRELETALENLEKMAMESD